jgi:hypothetical protein
MHKNHHLITFSDNLTIFLAVKTAKNSYHSIDPWSAQSRNLLDFYNTGPRIFYRNIFPFSVQFGRIAATLHLSSAEPG